MAEMKEILVANLTLDTVRRNNIPPLIVPQGDYGARVIRAVITEQGKPVTVESAAAVSIVAERSGDGEALAFSGKVNTDGSVTVPVTQWMLDVPEDDVTCHVVVTGSGYQYSTTSFLIEPQAKANPTEITPDDPRKDVVTEVLAGEKERVLAEGIRRTNENARKSAEEARVRAEEQRLTDEATRVSNEAERVSSELSRDATFKGWAQDIASLPSFDSRISANSDRLTNIEAGLPSSVWHVDDTAACVKDVPENARPKAIVNKIGGMTYKCTVAEGEDGYFTGLRSAKVTEVKSVGVNLMLPLVEGTFFGVTFKKDANGVYHLSGTATSDISKTYVVNLPKREYSLTLNHSKTVGTQTNNSMCIVGRNASNSWTISSYAFLSNTPSIADVEINNIMFVIYKGVNVDGVTIAPMLKKGSTAKPYTPYVEHILPIPEELRPANGINAEVYDSIELNENGSVTKRVKCGVVDLGTLDWIYRSGTNQLAFSTDVGAKQPSKQNAPSNVLCPKYQTVNPITYSAWSTAPDKSIFLSSSERLIVVRDTAYTDAATFKAAMSGVMLVYELAEPEVTDTYADTIIDVEGGGTMTFENEYGYDMPNTVTYMLKEVTS